jgi:hypothetical protein
MATSPHKMSIHMVITMLAAVATIAVAAIQLQEYIGKTFSGEKKAVQADSSRYRRGETQPAALSADSRTQPADSAKAAAKSVASPTGRALAVPSGAGIPKKGVAKKNSPQKDTVRNTPPAHKSFEDYAQRVEDTFQEYWEKQQKEFEELVR